MPDNTEDPAQADLVVLNNGMLYFAPGLDNPAGIYNMWLVGSLPGGEEKAEPFRVEVTRCEANLVLLGA